MARPQTTQPTSTKLTQSQLLSGVSKLKTRADELRAFDVQTLRKRFDAPLEALAFRVNDTLADIFGEGSSVYNNHIVTNNFDSLGLRMDWGSGSPAPDLDAIRANSRDELDSTAYKLESLIELLKERISENAESVVPSPLASEETLSRKVFIVHGHDSGAKETAARFLTKLDLTPIILHEQENGGRTIIEKFETYSDVAFALVLFTPDDVGHSAANPAASNLRPRQNVVLELGFFLGKLGRRRVCVLTNSANTLEIPTDYSGIIYIPMDDAGAWQFLVAREMKAAKMNVDTNKLIGS